MNIDRRRRFLLGAGALASLALACSACAAGPEALGAAAHPRQGVRAAEASLHAGALEGMPDFDPSDLYAADRPNQLSPTVRHDPSFVYVPNTESNTVSVIDPATYRVVRTVAVGDQPQHVVPG